ncbi:MAG: metallophosphoesterase family protein [Candidatus Bathyarchaeia archaeon]
MRFAVLADAHIGRSIPLAIGEHRRKAFSSAFSRAVDAIIAEGVDYVFICGDLFERKTLRPDLVQFVHDELYRLASDARERHGRNVKILVIRGNHDGRPQSNTLDYIKHPLADYLFIFDEDNKVYHDDKLQVFGLGYYDEIGRAFESIIKPVLRDSGIFTVLMVHGFISGYHEVPPYSSSLIFDQLSETNINLVLAGHYHKRCPPKKMDNGWMLTPGSLEMYDFAETPDKGFYIVEDPMLNPSFRWIPLEPIHLMKQLKVESRIPEKPIWFGSHITEAVREFSEELKRSGKPGYLRVYVRGILSEGYPRDIPLEGLDRIKSENPLLLWVDIDTIDLECPPIILQHELERADVSESLSAFGDFARNIKEMHHRVREVLEEESSIQTGLLTQSHRAPLINEWVKHFEEREFWRGGE